MSDLSKRKLNIFQESLLIVKRQKRKQRTNSCWTERLKVDRGQDKIPGCISLVSIGYETMTVIRARACAKRESALLNISVYLSMVHTFEQ